jgi:hypothetical protein
MDPNFQTVAAAGADAGSPLRLTDEAGRKFRELGVSSPTLPRPSEGRDANVEQIRADARLLAGTAIVDIGVFFAVLLVGFAYVWKQGDLNWVRAFDGGSGGETEVRDAPGTASER